MALAAQLRLIHLELVIRLRQFGLWPWALLVGWSLFAAGQEPRLLRGFDIHLGPQAIWSGATILLVALAAGAAAGSGRTGSESTQLRRKGSVLLVVGGTLVVMVGLTHAGLMLVGDLVAGDRVAWFAALRSGSCFAVAALPAAVGVTCLGPLWSRSLVARFGLGLVVCYSLNLSSVCFSAPSVTTVCASILAALGAVVASAAIVAHDS